jgi:hypothetical protein
MNEIYLSFLLRLKQTFYKMKNIKLIYIKQKNCSVQELSIHKVEIN